MYIDLLTFINDLSKSLGAGMGQGWTHIESPHLLLSSSVAFFHFTRPWLAKLSLAVRSAKATAWQTSWLEEKQDAALQLTSCHLICWDKPSSFDLEIQGYPSCILRSISSLSRRKLRQNTEKELLFLSENLKEREEKQWNKRWLMLYARDVLKISFSVYVLT